MKNGEMNVKITWAKKTLVKIPKLKIRFTLPVFYSVDYDLSLIYEKCVGKFWQNCHNIYEIDEVKQNFLTQFVMSPI